MTEQPQPDQHNPYLALQYRDFRLLLGGKFLANLGEQMVAVAVGWQIYALTHSSLALGIVGLVEVVPVILLSLPAGHLVDHANRKGIVLLTKALLALCSLCLGIFTVRHVPVAGYYVILLLMGCCWAYSNPAGGVLVTQTVPESAFSNSAMWSSNSWQLASAIGPALGGLGVALFHGHTQVVYFTDAAMSMGVLALLWQITGQREPAAHESYDLKSLLAGIQFLRDTPILLSAITLDMFAVLLGGATALLPVYAVSILHVGASGLGWLRAMPSIGASLMAIIIAHMPPFRRAGRTLLIAVAGFGICTIIFGVSTSFPLSLLMLLLLGALDNVSVVIRSSLLLLRAPDAMRGRVSAVNSIFVGTSNEMGMFESGMVARLVGPVLSVVVGGIGTVAVVLLCALRFPELRRLTTLEDEVEAAA